MSGAIPESARCAQRELDEIVARLEREAAERRERVRRALRCDACRDEPFACPACVRRTLRRLGAPMSPRARETAVPLLLIAGPVVVILGAAFSALLVQLAALLLGLGCLRLAIHVGG